MVISRNRRPSIASGWVFPGLVMVALLAAGCVSVQKEVPSAQAPETAPEASVTFASSPNHAEVWIDDKFVGSCPLQYSLVPGVHRVVIRAPGFDPWERDLHVKSGVPTNVHAVLEAAGSSAGKP